MKTTLAAKILTQRRLEKAYYLAEWVNATSGTPEANRREAEAQKALYQYLLNNLG